MDMELDLMELEMIDLKLLDIEFYDKMWFKRRRKLHLNLLYCLKELIKNRGAVPITIVEISKLIGKSYRQSNRIVKDLQRAGFVDVKQGRNGGVLAKHNGLSEVVN